MAKTISFPLYEAQTANGDHIAGPSTDCTRMMNAAETYKRFAGVETTVVYIRTLTAEEAQYLNR